MIPDNHAQLQRVHPLLLRRERNGDKELVTVVEYFVLYVEYEVEYTVCQR